MLLSNLSNLVIVSMAFQESTILDHMCSLIEMAFPEETGEALVN